MKLKKLILITSLLMVLLLGIGISTANENVTAESVGLDDQNTLEDSNLNEDESLGYGETYNAKIIAKDMTVEYDDEIKLSVYIVDNNNNPIRDAEPYFDDYLNSEYESDGHYYFYPQYYDAGTHKVEFSLFDGKYNAETVAVNLKIVKSVFYGDVKCKSYYGTDRTTLVMKATVYNPYEDCYEDGYVTFKVNGKSYKVKTKNGVATKKIKIKKAGTYTYSAVFTNKNYKSSLKGKAKLYVYKTSKKARTFNVKGYKIVVPLSKYKKLVNAKNTKKAVFYELKTNKVIKQTYRHYYYGNKYVYKTVKARGIICISFGGKTGLQTAPENKYSLYLFTRYQGPDNFCKPYISGIKISSVINKLNNGKTKW